MTWFNYDDQHRDFEHNESDFEQKLKGSVSFSLDIQQPPKVDIQIDVKKKKGFAYKIREKIKDVKRNTRELF